MNWKIIGSNLKESREQIGEIEKRIIDKDYPSEGELQVLFEHAYHHLNTAWNIRRIKTKQYAKQTDSEFNKWGRFPKEIEAYRVKTKRTKKTS